MRKFDERAELDDFELNEHYDFSNAVRGRFYDAKKVSTTIRKIRVRVNLIKLTLTLIFTGR